MKNMNELVVKFLKLGLQDALRHFASYTFSTYVALQLRGAIFLISHIYIFLFFFKHFQFSKPSLNPIKVYPVRLKSSPEAFFCDLNLSTRLPFPRHFSLFYHLNVIAYYSKLCRCCIVFNQENTNLSCKCIFLKII